MFLYNQSNLFNLKVLIVKKLFCLSFIAISFGFQGIAFAQQQGTQLSQEEYQTIKSVVCNSSTSTSSDEIASAIDSSAGISVSLEQVERLKEIAEGMMSLPQIQRDRMCMR